MGFKYAKKEIVKHEKTLTDQLPKEERNILSENKSDKSVN
jgi:hypothetical protein